MSIASPRAIVLSQVAAVGIPGSALPAPNFRPVSPVRETGHSVWLPKQHRTRLELDGLYISSGCL